LCGGWHFDDGDISKHLGYIFFSYLYGLNENYVIFWLFKAKIIIKKDNIYGRFYKYMLVFTQVLNNIFSYNLWEFMGTFKILCSLL
jgi:hypothetical protein